MRTAELLALLGEFALRVRFRFVRHYLTEANCLHLVALPNDRLRPPIGMIRVKSLSEIPGNAQDTRAVCLSVVWAGRDYAGNRGFDGDAHDSRPNAE